MNDSLTFIIMFTSTWAIVGITLFIVGIGILHNRKRKILKCTSITKGKVEDLVRQQNYDSDGGYSSTWHPVFIYEIGELKYIKESNYGTTQSKYAIGQEVEIHYNPEDPNEYYVTGDNMSKIVATILASVGMFAIIVSVVFLIIALYNL